jgi:hypothetical protein
MTAIGYQAGYLVIANGNTAVGTTALRGTDGPTSGWVQGTNNTAVGYQAGYIVSTGATNTLVGAGAGSNITTGSNNSCLGTSAQPASASTSNTITLGDANITTLRCQTTSITSLSDERDKKDIVDVPAGLDFIQRVRPVSFKWAMRNLYNTPGFVGKQDIPEFGFVAQELQTVQEDTGITVPNLVSDENPDRLEVAPSTLIPILIKAVQELTARVQQLEAKA